MAIRQLALLVAAGALSAGSTAWTAPKPAGKTGGSKAARVATKPAASRTTANASSGSTTVVAATVNGEPITEKEWLDRLRLMAGKNALDNLVREKVLRQEARKHGVTVSAGEVASKAREFEQGYRQRTGGDAKFNDFLKQQGLTLPSFQAAMRYSAEMQTLQQKLSQKLGEQVQVSDQELQDTYEKQKFQFSEPAQVRFAHILIKFPSQSGAEQSNKAEVEAEQNQTKERAQEILEKAKAPDADFAALAKEFSQDTDTKEKGGELPAMSFTPWGPPFDKLVFQAPVGLMDEPVRSHQGYHIVKVLEKKAQRTKPFDEVKEDLRKRLLDQRRVVNYREYMQKAERTAKTEIKLKF